MKYQGYQKEQLDLLNRRSLALHKSSSVSHRLPQEEREHTRAYYEAIAEKINTEIIDKAVKQYPDKRPAPLPELEHLGNRMVIQRYDGVNCWYVREDKFDPALYEYIVLDYRDHVAAQISRH